MESKEKNLAMEIYYGLKNEEYGMGEANKIFGSKVKCSREGGLKVRMDEVNNQMKNYIKKGKVGQINKPFRIEDKIVILKVDEYREKELSQEIEKLIIKEMLDKFINIGIGDVCALLCDEE